MAEIKMPLLWHLIHDNDLAEKWIKENSGA